MLSKLLASILLLLLVACSHEQDGANSNVEIKSERSVKAVPSQNSGELKQKTTIRAIFLKNSNNRTSGNFTDVQYLIENYSENTLLADKLDCNDNGGKITCEAVTDLNALKPGIYRLVVMSGKGLLGSDVFEIIPNLVPVVITIDNESTGFYLIQLITRQTGFLENEIYQRVAHILAVPPDQDFDMQITLYDLFMYYGGSQDWKKALQVLTDKLIKNEPVAIEGQDGISGSQKPIY